MQNVTQKYQEAIQSYDRKFLIKAVFCQPIVGAAPDETGQRPVQEVAVLTGADNLVSMTLEEAAAADDHISMGSFCSTKLTAELIDAPKDIDYDNVMIKAYSGLLIEDETYEYVPLGTFYITEVSTKNDYKNLTLTAYDGACLLEEPFSIDEGYPMSIEELVRQIAAGKEFSLHPDNEYKEYLLPAFKEGYTCRQMLGFAAGLMGCNVRFDRLGRLQFYWYQEPALQTTIDRQNQYLHEFIPSTVSPVTVTSLICSDGERTYTRGKGTSGLELTFENPYMTETIMETIWQERVADMDTAETITTLQVAYSGAPDTEHILTGTYNQSLAAFRCTDLSNVHPGTLMEMTYELDQISYSRNIMVESVDEEKSQFTFTLEETDEDQEELNLPEDLTARFTITRQWLVTAGDHASIEKNDLLKVSGQGVLIVSMIDREAGELYLTDTSKDPIYGMAGGTEMTLIKQKVNDYRICYLPGELKWRGNPALEAGDIIMAEKADGSCENFYIMTQNLRLSGGLSSQLAAKGENETSANFSSAGDGPTDKKLTRVYTSLQETILKATNRITGQSGGHVVINENDSGPAEILIMDTDDIRTAKKVWRWNQGGLGYSSNGYNGPYGTAVTQDGEIVGSYIQAESIAGSKLKIDSQVIEKIVAGINAGEQKINSASLDIDSEDISEAIKMQVSQSGGTNKICNSVGAYDLQGWICSGDVQRLNGEDQKINLISGRAFSLSAGATLESDLSVAPVRLTAGLSYTLSAVIKHNDCYGSLQLISGSGTILAQIDAGGSGEGWQKYEISFAVTESDIEGLFTIKLTSENGSFVVGDLLLNEGSQTTWSAYPGEVDSTTLTMSQFGITIRQENAQTKTVIDSAGTRVINIENEDTDQTEDVAAEYTKDGVEAKSLIAREQIAAGRVRMISLSDKQMAAWIINSDSEVDL